MFLETSPVIPNVELVNVHLLIKCLFSKEILTKAVDIPRAGRISQFLVNWQKLTLNQDILSVVNGYRTFIKMPFQQKIPNFTKMNKKQIALVDLELKEMLRKGAIKRAQPAQGEFLSNLFLVRKKDGGYRPVINLKMLNHSFSPFQNGKLFSVKAHNTEGRLNVQTGFEGCILQCSIGLKLEEVCKASKEGDPLRVHVEPVFWIRSNTKGVYKVIENSNLSSEKDQCQSDNIFGQYVDFELHNTRNSHQPRHSHISPAELGFIINIKKSMLHPCQKIEFLRMELDSIKVTLSMTPEKVQKLVKTCQNNLRSHQERIQGVDQGD